MKVITISSQTPVAAESRLKSILLNRVIERLEHSEKCEETTEKSMENVEKHPQNARKNVEFLSKTFGKM